MSDTSHQSDPYLALRQQNAEAIRINAQQNERIAVLESKNIALKQEIIKLRIQHSERLGELHGIISNLKNENIIQRLQSIKLPKPQPEPQREPKPKPKKKSPIMHRSNVPQVQQENAPQEKQSKVLKSDNTDGQDAISNNESSGKIHPKRSNSKPINYTLPGIHKKLRKGDAFTFGNE